MMLGIKALRLINLRSVQAIPLIFRCDATSELGWGHFQRCYTLAEIASQSGRYKVHFLSRSLPRSLEKKLSQIHAGYQKLPDEATLEDDLKALQAMFGLLSRKHIIVCVDHPLWTAECFQSLKQDSRMILLAMDDGLKRHYECDFLINQNLEAEKIAYSTSPDCQKLLGPKYCLVREEIHTLRQHPTERMADQFQFMITLGGADRWGLAVQVIDAIKRSGIKFETHVVVNSNWAHLEKAKRLIGNHPRIHIYEDPSFYPQLLARADLVLCSGGHTTYELAYLGVPMLTASLLPHQVQNARIWSERGVAEYLGAAETLNPETVVERIVYWMERDQELENRGVAAQKLIDGRGKFRILENVNKVIKKKKDDSLEKSAS